MILEKIKSKLTVFFLYGSSFDIVRWDMTLKKKKKLSYHKSVMYYHDSMQFDIIIFYLISLPPPNPKRLRGTYLHEWIQKAIFFCVFFFFSYFWRQFMWCFEKAEKIASMSEMLKKCWYNKHHKRFVYRQHLTVRYNSLKWPEMLLGELKCSLFALLVFIQCLMSNWSGTHVLVSVSFFGKVKNLLKALFLFGMCLLNVCTNLSHMRA